MIVGALDAYVISLHWLLRVDETECLLLGLASLILHEEVSGPGDVTLWVHSQAPGRGSKFCSGGSMQTHTEDVPEDTERNWWKSQKKPGQVSPDAAYIAPAPVVFAGLAPVDKYIGPASAASARQWLHLKYARAHQRLSFMRDTRSN